MKLTVGIFVLIIGVTLLVAPIWVDVIGGYHWRNEYLNHWTLADRSSTIPSKQQHIRDFVNALEKGNDNGRFSSYDALLLQTPSNNFQTNLTALKTLSQRLDEIQGMDPNSFQYNTAIQQITAQEQGEAREMLGILQGCFFLANYPIAWNWIEGLMICSAIVIGIFGVILIELGIDEY